MTDFQTELATVFVLGLFCHMIGDYVIQNDWMALEKTKRWWPAIVHGVTYTLPFLFITQSPLALFVICSTHVVLDHTYAVRHIIWARNQLAPKAYRPPHTPTGFNVDRPDWIAVWLMIIVDNLAHITINTIAVMWL